MLSQELFHIAWEARCRAFSENLQDHGRRHGATTAIIMSAATAEGFINELGEYCGHFAVITDYLRSLLEEIASLKPKLSDFEKKELDDLRKPPWLRNLSTAINEIEESKGSVRLKYHVASQVLSQQTFDKGSQPFQDFATLIRLRDDHMHLKTNGLERMLEGSKDRKMQLAPSGYLKDLIAKGLALNDQETVRWLRRVQTPQMADWACRTAITMILTVIEKMPRQFHEIYCLHRLVENLFRPNCGSPKPWDQIFTEKDSAGDKVEN